MSRTMTDESNHDTTSVPGFSELSRAESAEVCGGLAHLFWIGVGTGVVLGVACGILEEGVNYWAEKAYGLPPGTL